PADGDVPDWRREDRWAFEIQPGGRELDRGLLARCPEGGLLDGLPEQRATILRRIRHRPAGEGAAVLLAERRRDGAAGQRSGSALPMTTSERYPNVRSAACLNSSVRPWWSIVITQSSADSRIALFRTSLSCISSSARACSIAIRARSVAIPTSSRSESVGS